MGVSEQKYYRTQRAISGAHNPNRDLDFEEQKDGEADTILKNTDPLLEVTMFANPCKGRDKVVKLWTDSFVQQFQIGSTNI